MTSQSSPTPAPSPNKIQVPEPATTLATKAAEWSRPIIAIFSLSVFGWAFWVASQAGDKTNFNILVGSIVSLVTTVSGYYVGSSVGSQKKDAVIDSALKTAQFDELNK